jgi:hypothetical protein
VKKENARAFAAAAKRLATDVFVSTLNHAQPENLPPMTVTDLKVRVERLDELARGLSKEVVLWKEGSDPLLYLERKAYLKAIQDALAGVEEARVVLARARQRLEDEETRRPAGVQR